MEREIGEVTWETLREEADGFLGTEDRARRATGGKGGARDEARSQRESLRAARVFATIGRRGA